MTEPRHEGSASPRRGSHGLFWIGLAVFIGVALAHPFYAYEVQTRLAARDAAAFAPAKEPVKEAASEPTAAEQRQAAIAARQAEEAALVEVPMGVRVHGTIFVGKEKVVIADLGELSLAEATPILCQQTAALARDAGAGQPVRMRVQRYRGAERPEDIGEIVCE